MQGNLGNFACRIRNARNFCLWNPGSWALESGMQLKEFGLQRMPSSSSAWNPESPAWNPELIQHYMYSLTWNERSQGMNRAITVT